MTRGVKRLPIHEGDVFFPAKPIRRPVARRIVGLIEDCAVYSDGGSSTRSCKVATLMRWGKRQSEATVAPPAFTDQAGLI